MLVQVIAEVHAPAIRRVIAGHVRVAQHPIAGSHGGVAKGATAVVGRVDHVFVGVEARIVRVFVALGIDVHGRQPLLFAQPVAEGEHVLDLVTRIAGRLGTGKLATDVVLEIARADGARDAIAALDAAALGRHEKLLAVAPEAALATEVG